MHFPQGQRQQPLNRNCWIGVWLSWLLPEHFSTCSAWDGNWGSAGCVGFKAKCRQKCVVKAWAMGEAGQGRAGGMPCPHILPQGLWSLQHSPPEQAGCAVEGEQRPVLLPELGMAQGDTHRAWGVRFTTRVKPCFLEWEEGTSPGAKMSVTLLRS